MPRIAANVCGGDSEELWFKGGNLASKTSLGGRKIGILLTLMIHDRMHQTFHAADGLDSEPHEKPCRHKTNDENHHSALELLFPAKFDLQNARCNKNWADRHPRVCVGDVRGGSPLRSRFSNPHQIPLTQRSRPPVSLLLRHRPLAS